MKRRRVYRPPTRAERLATWQAFLDACSEEERAQFDALPARLRDGVQARCETRAVRPHFGADGAAELLVALVEFLAYYDRTCRVRRKGMMK